MPSDRATAALVASALAYSHDVDSPDAERARLALLDAATLYRSSRSDGVARCTFCGNEVRPGEFGSYRKVEGWAEIRRKGGTNQLVDQRPTGEVACASCVRERRLGIATEQTSLL